MVCTVTILNFPPLLLQRPFRTLRSWFMLGTSSKAASYSGNTSDHRSVLFKLFSLWNPFPDRNTVRNASPVFESATTGKVNKENIDRRLFSFCFKASEEAIKLYRRLNRSTEKYKLLRVYQDK